MGAFTAGAVLAVNTASANIASQGHEYTFKEIVFWLIFYPSFLLPLLLLFLLFLPST